MNSGLKVMMIVLGIILGSVITYSAAELFEDKEYIEARDEKHHPDEEKKHETHEEHTDIVKLDDSVIEELGIKIEKAGPVKIVKYTRLTGEISPIPENIAHIVPRYEGIVKTVHKRTGDKVNKGDVIAVIESNESLVDYDVISSISGTVTEVHMTPGEYVSGNDHVVKIADLGKVWAEIFIYEKDLKTVREGQNVILSGMFDDDITEGKIFYKSPVVNEKNRTGTARVILDNHNGIWMPGMFITAKVETHGAGVPLGIKKSSLQNFENNLVIFVKDEDGFEPVPVKIGMENEKYAEIISDLKPGTNYVTEGSFTIKSELMKGSFGGGHNH